MSLLSRVWTAIDGNKTYLGFIAAGLLGIFWNYGLINDHDAKLIATVVGTWTGISMRYAIEKKKK